MLIDQHGRRIRKLRLSLTDKCNLRCHYCMPVDQTFMEESKYLGVEELEEILRELTQKGLEEVRLTGGEPLLRKCFSEILLQLSRLPLKLSLTTNGILLDRYFEDLKSAKVSKLNISLDSLNPVTFRKITFGNYFERVVTNIRSARDFGFEVKVNVVAMRGVNDHEICDFVAFSEKEKVEVRFLELMRIGHACADQQDQFISARELISRLRGTLKPITMPADSTSYNFLTEGGGNVGFIASESQPFCGQCSRWRLSADGVLRACLLKDDGLSLKGLSAQERQQTYLKILGMKPALRPAEVQHSMNMIGG